MAQSRQTEQGVNLLHDWDDGGAQLIQQTLKTANGAEVATNEYIHEPSSFRPVAQAITNHELYTEKLHHIVNDYSGMPRELCVEDGEPHR